MYESGASSKWFYDVELFALNKDDEVPLHEIEIKGDVVKCCWWN